MQRTTTFNIENNSKGQVKLIKSFGAGTAIECAEIIKKHPSLTVFLTSDRQRTQILLTSIKQLAKDQVDTISDWETLPYEALSPSLDIIYSRLSRLYELSLNKKGALILPVQTLMQKVCPSEFVMSHSLCLRIKDKYHLDDLVSKLAKAGYRNVKNVLYPGEFARRGSVVDIFPMGSKQAYRLDFFDNFIEGIYPIDVKMQKIKKPLQEVSVLPSREFPTNKDALEHFCNAFVNKFGKGQELSIYKQVSKGILPAGIEYWQPMFFEHSLALLVDYFPKDTLFVLIGNVKEALNKFWKQVNNCYESYRYDRLRPLLDPKEIWISPSELSNLIERYSYIKIEEQADKDHYLSLSSLGEKICLSNLSNISKKHDKKIVISVESKGKQILLKEKTRKIGLDIDLISSLKDIKENISCIFWKVEKSVIDVKNKIIIISEYDLQDHIERKQNTSVENDKVLEVDIGPLAVGKAVVHADNGIGIYEGLETIEIGDTKNEYLKIVYANSDILYVPVSDLHLISPYIGSQDPKLSKLGTDQWEKTRTKVAKQVRDTAAHLLAVYAKRASISGFCFKVPDNYKKFCKEFPFEPTEDQEKAINAVLKDMCQQKVMDRLICGDVGFGKTEVAMRAAFIAASNGKQVAVLTPTTLLAQQHFDRFAQRFANWPFNVGLLSRFKTNKERQEIVKDLNKGNINILIGTHKLLQKAVQWKDLGLVIVDEEHRFGVRHKEKLNSMYPNIDLLTMTATPIPRTLHMAMSYLRDLSIIATPPKRRRPVKTFVHVFQPEFVREAIMRELMRGGQVYYLYNNVKGVERRFEFLSQLIPEAEIAVANGQMPARQLERVMQDFYNQRYQILLCSSIIETGIDIPTVNTIVIERADMLGLAQLHQLRGRVGRSHNQAYAYFFTSETGKVSSDAKKRLKAIMEFDDLGSGFSLSMQDLDIRGPGCLLGEEQSGHIASIGLGLYTSMLQQAISAIQKGEDPVDFLKEIDSQVDLSLSSYIPDAVCSDIRERLSFYRKIAKAASIEELQKIREEMRQRFYTLPASCENLIETAIIKHQAKQIGIESIKIHKKGGTITLGSKHRIDPKFLIEMLRSSSTYKLKDSMTIKISKNLETEADRLNFVKSWIEQVSQHQCNLGLDQINLPSVLTRNNKAVFK